MKLAIFDLDGVIVSTDTCHYRAWKTLADKKGWHFDEKLNHQLRGVSRAESLTLVMRANSATESEDEIAAMLVEKNSLYRVLLKELSPTDILPGVTDLLSDLRSRGILTAIGSSSRNTPLILNKIGMADGFDIIVDGNAISRSKPDPEVFLKAAAALGIDPSECVVFEDAQAGVDAASAAGMAVVGIGDAGLEGADALLSTLSGTTLAKIADRLMKT